MGMDAEVLAIGPWGAFWGEDLDYDVSFYRDSIQTGDEEIICLVAVAYTTGQSRSLALVCGVDPWDLGHHKVKKIVLEPSTKFDQIWPEEWIGPEQVDDVAARLHRLLHAGCDLWYRPNG